MEILENYPLNQLTSFRIGGPAHYFVSVKSTDDLFSALNFAKEKHLATLLIGDGSNVLISDSGFKGLVIQIDLRGKQVVKESSEEVLLKVGAGENWDDVVAFVVQNNWWGIENLSGIPGRSGAFPVQNVGAYGQEASQVIEEVEILDALSRQIRRYSNQDCEFAYRKSIFNTEKKGKVIILNLTLRLNKKTKKNLNYTDLEKFFKEKKNINPSVSEIRNAVIEIRKKKFPLITDRVGTAGSFFKNLLLTEQKYNDLENHFKNNFPQPLTEKLQGYKNKMKTSQGIKIPTAFIIDSCGLKSESVGAVKVSENQALVIVNTGGGTAEDVLNLFKKVKKIVYDKTGVKLEPEPELIGFTEKQLNQYLN